MSEAKFTTHKGAYLVDDDEEKGAWKLDCECEEPCAEYRCTKCGERAKAYPKHVQCSCGCVYVEWINYAAWRTAHKHDCSNLRCPMR